MGRQGRERCRTGRETFGGARQRTAAACPQGARPPKRPLRSRSPRPASATEALTLRLTLRGSANALRLLLHFRLEQTLDLLFQDLRRQVLERDVLGLALGGGFGALEVDPVRRLEFLQVLP